MSHEVDAIGREVRETLRDLRLVAGPLETDMLRAAESLAQDPTSQYWRRIVIRAFSGYIEALVFRMKATTWKVAPLIGLQFSKDEVEVLTETRTVTQPGQPPSQRAKFIPMIENVKFAFRQFARVHSRTFELDTNSPGFQDFQHLVEVRNRLTHPKAPFDIGVNDESHKRCARAARWFESEYTRLLQICGAEIPTIVKAARQRKK